MLIVEVLLLALSTPGFSEVGGVQTNCLENLRGKEGRARVEIIFGVGALQEAEDERGVAHLLEHVLLRPLGFDHSNGATAWDYTSYHQDVRAGALEEAALDLLKALSPAALSGSLNARPFEVEKKIVLRELSDRAQSHEVRNDPLFGSTLLARAPGGSASSVRKLTPQVAERFYKAHYRKGNMAVMVRGATDCEKMRKALEPVLSTFTEGAASSLPKITEKEPGRRAMPSVAGRFQRGFYWYDASPEEELLLRVLGKHLEQQALEELRKKRGLTYSPSVRFLRRGSGGALELVVTTDGESRSVEVWFKETIKALLDSRAPLVLMKSALTEVKDSMEADSVRAALAAIRGESLPVTIAERLSEAQAKKILPIVLAEKRGFGSSVPQGNWVSIVILVAFGVLVLGVVIYAGRQFL